MSNSKATLLQDIISFGKNKICYGRAGETVTITNKRSDDVWIVKNSKQIVFAVKPSQVKEQTNEPKAS
ncbi:hypothetical protein ACFOW1_01535 [Parasediminibacterium paludis]|uniref:Uncharacterized protein n=1 Tax=Parasediminibacterium paludis TaxID=908966 RepID=A0ABV8PRQ6_9BACT